MATPRIHVSPLADMPMQTECALGQPAPLVPAQPLLDRDGCGDAPSAVPFLRGCCHFHLPVSILLDVLFAERFAIGPTASRADRLRHHDDVSGGHGPI
jgi:hypothetical protein